MRDNLSEILDEYCDNEIVRFKKHESFCMLYELVNELNYALTCSYERIHGNNGSISLYLNISVCHKNGEFIEIFDEGCLSAATILALVDKKERIIFYPWDSDDFLDSINWIMRNLRNIKNDC